jgi:hypothetical protein
LGKGGLYWKGVPGGMRKILACHDQDLFRPRKRERERATKGASIRRYFKGPFTSMVEISVTIEWNPEASAIGGVKRITLAKGERR